MQTVSCFRNIILLFFTFYWLLQKNCEKPELYTTIVENCHSFKCVREIKKKKFGSRWKPLKNNNHSGSMCSSKKYPYPLQGGHFCFRPPSPWNSRSRGHLGGGAHPMCDNSLGSPCYRNHAEISSLLTRG